MIAKVGHDGAVVRQPDVDACIEFIKKNNITVFVADPFAETHSVEENSNEQMKEVAMMYRDIARRAGCAVLIVHHTSKPQQASSDGHAGNMNTARGASSLLGVARVVQTFYGMSVRDAEKFGIKEEDRHRYIRLDDAKANLSLIDANAHWYERISVTIANGDEVGILQIVDFSSREAEAATEERDFQKTVIACLLAQVDGKEITLNAAAKMLAWGNDKRFHRYRQSDANGTQRVSKGLRNVIIRACQAKITITDAKNVNGFSLSISAQAAGVLL